MNKPYGNAVFTALQAQHESISELERLFNERKFMIAWQGKSTVKWTDDFWQQMAILLGNNLQKKKENEEGR